MIPFEIPLQPAPLKMTISLGNTQYVLIFTWNVPSQCWIMDVYDSNNNPLTQGIPLVTGADLLAQFEYLGFTGSMVVETDHDIDAIPTFSNLGTTSHLYFLTP